MHALVALALIWLTQGATPAEQTREYLQRPVPRSARFLDHGDIAISVAGGTPQVYRLDLRVGLFDHVSIGVTGHWLPGQRAPQLWPVGAIALWRYYSSSRRGAGSRRAGAPLSGIGFEIGGHYRPVLYPPVDPTQRFVPQTHFALGSIVVSSGPFSAGIDAGAAHTRLAVVDPREPLKFDRRTVFGGGVFARIGNRRAGLTVDALAALTREPLLVFEIAVDLRFGAFSERGL